MTETQPEPAYMEVAHYPVGLRADWPQDVLLEACKKSVCHNTGWPVGVVLTTPDTSPRVLGEGIQAVVRTGLIPERFDFWSLDRAGYFYFMRRLEEDTLDRPAVGRVVYFDTRIWRVAEALLHCAKLYSELQVPVETEISIAIAHHGLQGRILRASDPLRAMIFARTSSEDDSSWSKAVPLDSIEPNLNSIVEEIVTDLFMLFDFWKPSPKVLQEIVQRFLASRV